MDDLMRSALRSAFRRGDWDRAVTIAVLLGDEPTTLAFVRGMAIHARQSA